jgi:PST family polysaccharide transporter
VVALAELQRGLRFKTMAVVAVLGAFLTAGLSVTMVWLGFGPYSFVFPATATGAITAVVYWVLAAPKIRWGWALRRWRFLLSDSGAVLGTSGLQVLIVYGDYLCLGLFQNEDMVGVYFFAFNLSMNAVTLVSNNLSAVLFPALAKLGGEPERQRMAFVRASRVMAVSVVPLMFLQAMLGGPALRLVYGQRWVDSIVPFTVLSIGTAFVFLGAPGTSMIKARGGFGLLFRFGLVQVVTFFALVAPAAWYGGATSVAVAVAVYYVVFGPWGAALALGGRWSDWAVVARIFIPVMCVAVAACVPFAVTTFVLPTDRAGDVVRLLTGLVLVPVVYTILIRRIVPDASAEVVARLRGLLSRLPVSI